MDLLLTVEEVVELLSVGILESPSLIHVAQVPVARPGW
jgi:hypothetical protein